MSFLLATINVPSSYGDCVGGEEGAMAVLLMLRGSLLPRWRWDGGVVEEHLQLLGDNWHDTTGGRKWNQEQN